MLMGPDAESFLREQGLRHVTVDADGALARHCRPTRVIPWGHRKRFSMSAGRRSRARRALAPTRGLAGEPRLLAGRPRPAKHLSLDLFALRHRACGPVQGHRIRKGRTIAVVNVTVAVPTSARSTASGSNGTALNGGPEVRISVPEYAFAPTFRSVADIGKAAPAEVIGEPGGEDDVALLG
jgi:hypothetical protein